MRCSRARRSPWSRSREVRSGADSGARGRAGCAPGERERVRACMARAQAHRARDGVQTTVSGLPALRDWLEALAVTQGAIEATGVYWRPGLAGLEGHFELLLVNARHVKQVPGRKTDGKDAQWLCQLVEAGLLRPSLVPPKPIRTLRKLTRYRKPQINDRQREAARLHKILEDTGIKLGCVASDIMRASPAETCSTRWWPAPPTRSCSPSSRAGSCARRSPRCARRSRVALRASTR